MKTTLRALIYPILAVLDLLFTYLIADCLVNWWAPAFAIIRDYSDRGTPKSGARLPVCLTWFDTFDADLDQGVRDGTIIGTSVFWNRVKWLYRNSAYGWSYWALGTAFDAVQWRVIRYENMPGRLTFIAVSINGYFNIHVTRFGLRFKFGWKAWDYYEAASNTWNPLPWGPAWRVPFVFSISLA